MHIFFLLFLAIYRDIKVSKNVMIFPSIYVFTLFLISTSFGDDEDDFTDFCKDAYEDSELDDAYNCPSDATGPTNLTKIGRLEIICSDEITAVFRTTIDANFIHTGFHYHP